MKAKASGPAFISGSDAYSPAEMWRNSVFQLPQKSRQIPKLSDRLKFSLLVEFEDAHAVYVNDLVGLGFQPYLPVDGSFLAAHDDFLDVGLDLPEGGGDRRIIGGD